MSCAAATFSVVTTFEITVKWMKMGHINRVVIGNVANCVPDFPSTADILVTLGTSYAIFVRFSNLIVRVSSQDVVIDLILRKNVLLEINLANGVDNRIHC